MKVLKFISFSLMVLCSGFSFAAGSETNVTVSSIYVPTSGGNPFVYFSANALPGCYNANSAYLPLFTDGRSQTAYSALLAAQMASKNVRIYYTVKGSSGWSMCTIDAVQVFN